MSQEQPNESTVKVVHDLRAVRDLISAIPPSWRSAEIAVGDSIGGALRVLRVSLHRNANGRRIVILHKDVVIPQP